MTQLPGERYPDPVRTTPTTGAEASGGAHATRPGGSSGSSSSGGSGTAGVAKDEAAATAQTTGQEAGHVAGVAKDQAAGVASEAGRQAKDLLSQGRSQLQEQAGVQKDRAATGLHSLSEEFRKLADGEGGSGVASDLVSQVATRASSAAQWVGDREPSDLVREVQDFARRRPGAFLAIAAGVGLVAGRLSRGIAANAKEAKDEREAATAPAPAQGTATTATGTYGTGTGTETTDNGWTIPATEDHLSPRGTATNLGGGPLAGSDDLYGDPRRSRAPVSATHEAGAHTAGARESTGSHDPGGQPSLGALFSSVTADLSTLVRQEVALAKAEVTQSASRAGKGAGLLSGAAVAGHFVLLFLSIALWWGLGNATGRGWSALIVAVVWAVVAAVLAVVGRREVQQVKGLPRTAETLKKVPAALKGDEESNR